MNNCKVCGWSSDKKSMIHGLCFECNDVRQSEGKNLAVCHMCGLIDDVGLINQGLCCDCTDVRKMVKESLNWD